ncbi:MAG: hypothetical protein BGN86_03455 [Caulobacterales bacterium 68-7]|nr:MAG: hypothetical protein BGN86_03455 [Caulobacterales bacterium 68-7]
MAQPAAVPLTETLQGQLEAVNRAVNRSIRPVAERGDEDVWSLPLAEGRADGDCEDYVLEKRRALIGLGVPAETLSIAIVRSSARQEHAVLLVSTEAGEVVLDNRTPWILPWRKTNYVWLKRQSAADQSQWVEIASR